MFRAGGYDVLPCKPGQSEQVDSVYIRNGVSVVYKNEASNYEKLL